jgi:hypothetical protein
MLLFSSRTHFVSFTTMSFFSHRFIVVIGTILLGFAVCFRVLLGQNNEDFATFG